MRVLFTSIALATLVSAAPAIAESPEETFAVAIPAADLNLYNAAGRATFTARAKARARAVCVGTSDSPLQQSLQVDDCQARFMRSAVRQLQLAHAPVGGAVLAAR